MNPAQQPSSLSRASSSLHAAIVTIIVLTVSFFLQWKWCGSMLQFPEANFEGMLQSHLSWYPFSMRYFTSYSIQFLHNTAGLSLKTSFILLQFSLAFLLGLAFDRYLVALKLKEPIKGVGVFLLLSSYPILAAFMEPVHTWDDMWAYLFTTLTLLYMLRSRIALGLVWFTLACLAREQSLLFLPMVVYGLTSSDQPRRLSRAIGLAIIPLLPLILLYWWRWQPSDPHRFQLILFNFAGPLRTSDTLFSIFISFGWVWVASASAMARRENTKTRRFLTWGAVATVPATILLAIFFTNARETRILFPPFLFLLPLAMEKIRYIQQQLSGHLSFLAKASGLTAVAALMTLGVVLGRLAFPAFEYRQCPDFQRLWAGINFGIILSLISWWLCASRFIQWGRR